jgi:hypothetical protein
MVKKRGNPSPKWHKQSLGDQIEDPKSHGVRVRTAWRWESGVLHRRSSSRACMCVQ